MLVKIEAYTGSEKQGNREFKGQVMRDLEADYAKADEASRFAVWSRSATVELQDVIRRFGPEVAQKHEIGAKIGPTPVTIAAKVAKMDVGVQANLIAQLLATPGIREALAALEAAKIGG